MQVRWRLANLLSLWLRVAMPSPPITSYELPTSLATPPTEFTRLLPISW